MDRLEKRLRKTQVEREKEGGGDMARKGAVKVRTVPEKSGL